MHSELMRGKRGGRGGCPGSAASLGGRTERPRPGGGSARAAQHPRAGAARRRRIRGHLGGTPGYGDTGTPGHGDTGRREHRDTGSRGHGDTGTQEHEDTGTRACAAASRQPRGHALAPAGARRYRGGSSPEPERLGKAPLLLIYRRALREVH